MPLHPRTPADRTPDPYASVGDIETMDEQLARLSAVAASGINGTDLRLGILPRATPFPWTPPAEFPAPTRLTRPDEIFGRRRLTLQAPP